MTTLTADAPTGDAPDVAAATDELVEALDQAEALARFSRLRVEAARNILARAQESAVVPSHSRSTTI